MNEKSSIINNKLLEIQLKWKNEVVKCFLENHKEQQSELSHPFYFRVSDKYTSFEKKIMIVGQETKNWGKYSEEVEEDYLQNCSVEYLESQLEKKTTTNIIDLRFGDFSESLMRVAIPLVGIILINFIVIKTEKPSR